MAARVIEAVPKTADPFAQSAKTLPQRYFISPEVFEEEKKKIFSRQWLLVGHQSDVAKTGEFFVTDVAGESILVTHDRGDASALSTMFVGIAARDCVRSEADMPRRFSVRIMPGLMDSMDG